MLQDYKLGFRMLLKYPGLTVAGGLALAVAIGMGAGWYDLAGKIMAPTIPLPEGDRLVLIETHNILTNEPEPRVLHDFLEWRRELQTIEELGAYRTGSRNLGVGNSVPEPIEVAELTAAAFATARGSILLGRGLRDADEMPGAPSVVVLGYEVWQRFLEGRQDAVGSIVKLGNTPATVIGIMPKGFAYPINHDAWTPLTLRASYAGLEGGAISVIGRLAPGISEEHANAELRVLGERAAAALPATHANLRPSVRRLGEAADGLDLGRIALRNLPVLLVLTIACLSVGTLVYARTATREGEMAVRSALGASRSRIVGQLFVEALVLASLAAAVGLFAADRALTWGLESVNRSRGGVPFWMTPGLKVSTILYAAGLATVCAAMLSFLPALKVTRARLQPHLANLGGGGATLRFGRLWTGAMIVQVALTAIGIPLAMETVGQAMRKLNIRAAFPSREYLAARIELDRPLDEEGTSAGEERRAGTFAALAGRIGQEPGVIAVSFADRAPGSLANTRVAEVSASAGGPAFHDVFRTSAVGLEFFATLGRPIVAGRAFHAGDQRPDSRTVIVNEAFARAFSRETGNGSPIGAQLRYLASSRRTDARVDEPRLEIVGVVRDIGLDPDDSGHELPYVFHAASPAKLSTPVITVRVRANPGLVAARLPVIAADVDPALLVRNAQPLNAWVRQRDDGLLMQAGALAAVTALVLFLSALGIFSLVSVSVSRRTREIALRAALGAHPRDLLAGVLSRAAVLMGGGIAAGAALLLVSVALGAGPSGRPAEDLALFAAYLAMTSAVMLAVGLAACLSPARRALRINPIDALREA